ncbi:ABC transporter permease [Aureimonas fodinaquatilis]|uniref:ABC transporter permease n=1 Tax=Aureimonas fodinaquatilis TaxID=2565783 RepID=A0A5B0DSC3_9HYPH|nr:ABC transporter permease [Aureimonas fodinaquatilis]KAA0968902.1 ABC transporter permease [Aureimonas fodinaquatilis]
MTTLDQTDRTIDTATPLGKRSGLARYLSHYGFAFGITLLAIVVLMALFAPLIAPHDPFAQDMTRRWLDPVWYADGTWAHPLGTDGFGRDYLSRLIYGARISILIGLFTMLLSGFIGVTLGLLGGYFGGWVDSVISFIIMTRLTVPVVLVATALSAIAGSTFGTVVIILGFLLWDRFAVVTRGAVQKVRSLEFVRAARAVGCSNTRIIIREIIPNIAPVILVIATLEVAQAILLEAALSFLGLGVQPPLPSWGLMIAEGKSQMLFKPWVITIPGIALFMLILAINLLGDALRDLTTTGGRV